jgi:ribonuclease R
MPRRADDVPIDAYLALLERKAPRPLSIAEMAGMLDADRYDRKTIRAALERAVAAHRLRRIGRTRYQWIRERDRVPRASRPEWRRASGRRHSAARTQVTGRYTRVRAGFGFVEVGGRGAETFGRDVLVRAGDEGGARHGDEVVVEIERRDVRRRRASGRVVAVTGRAHELLVGVLEHHRGRWWLVPLNDLEPPLPLDDAAPASDVVQGAVALVRPSATGQTGGIDRVLGSPDDHEVQVQAIAYEHGLRMAFPAAVQAEVTALPADPDPRDAEGRRDLRQLPFVTIDGETARDFDDAVCVEPISGGGERLWVAIADVAHYVRAGSALDAEAAARGTSVYFPDRAIPMLPPQLSTALCSLNPERDRLVLVAELVFDAAGARREVDCYRAIIRSRARLTYTTVAAVLSSADTPRIHVWREELAPLMAQLRHMHDLMRRLNARRVRAGSLDLDLPEALVDLSEEGRSIGVRVETRNDAHRLIEEFMLEANRAVAQLLRDRDLPLPYRIHEPPHPNDVEELNELLQPFGLAVSHEDEVKPKDVQRLLDRLQGHPLARVLSRQVLRALRQARYSTDNAGHFGLAFPIYCHFTSPIRRYPDLLVHRQLGRLFDGDVETARREAEHLATASLRSSQGERAAIEAERAMLDLKKAEFMQDHLLEPKPAMVVSVTAAGLFVELDDAPIEGLVRAERLDDGPWVFIESERALKGLRSRQRFRLGDRVEVEAIDVSLLRGRVEFTVLRRLGGGAERKAVDRKRRRTSDVGRRTRRRSTPSPARERAG